MSKELTVMMLTWEYPPRIVGGISPHVYHLSKNLAEQDLRVIVVTCDFPDTPMHEVKDGVDIFRIDSLKYPAPNFLSWIYLMNMNMQHKAAGLIKKLNLDVNIFHAHDWLVANTAIGLKHIFKKPLVATIHATQLGRNKNLKKQEKTIHETEFWLTYESWKVICCSNYMSNHVKWAFKIPDDKLEVIPNGVDIKKYVVKEDLRKFRSKFVHPEEKIVLFVGRLVYEKGVQVLINSLPKILNEVNVKLIIVGEGYMKEKLQTTLESMKLTSKVYFTGFADDETLLKLQKCADVCVVPSFFEPFGIVALESMAAKKPLIASDTGGLSEIIQHEYNGVKVLPNNIDSLANGVIRALNNEKLQMKLIKNAYKTVQEKYNWRNISLQTKALYEKVAKEYLKLNWK